MIPDQKAVWNRKHGSGEHEAYRGRVMPLAEMVHHELAPASRILELGCGVGNDTLFFASHGHSVVATDISEVIIEKDQRLFPDSGVEFSVLDMAKPLPYTDGSFDMVYAHLSIHYFDHRTTQDVVAEIARVLESGGMFAFACKSTKDFHYGNGEEIEKNVFVSKSGHVRHLFDEAYARELTEKDFVVAHLEEKEEIYTDEKSVILYCVARKK